MLHRIRNPSGWFNRKTKIAKATYECFRFFLLWVFTVIHISQFRCEPKSKRQNKRQTRTDGWLAGLLHEANTIQHSLCIGCGCGSCCQKDDVEERRKMLATHLKSEIHSYRRAITAGVWRRNRAKIGQMEASVGSVSTIYICIAFTARSIHTTHMHTNTPTIILYRDAWGCVGTRHTQNQHLYVFQSSKLEMNFIFFLFLLFSPFKRSFFFPRIIIFHLSASTKTMAATAAQISNL